MLILYLESNYTLHQHACIHITINTINTQLMFYLQLYYRDTHAYRLTGQQQFQETKART